MSGHIGIHVELRRSAESRPEPSVCGLGEGIVGRSIAQVELCK